MTKQPKPSKRPKTVSEDEWVLANETSRRFEDMHKLASRAAERAFDKLKAGAVVGELLVMANREGEQSADYVDDLLQAMARDDEMGMKILECFRKIGEHLFMFDTALMPGVLTMPAIFNGRTFLQTYTAGVGRALIMDVEFLALFPDPIKRAAFKKRLAAPLSDLDAQRMIALWRHWDTLLEALGWREQNGEEKTDITLVNALKLIDAYNTAFRRATD